MKIAVNSSLYERIESGVPLYIKNLYTSLLKSDVNNEYFFLQRESAKTLGRTVSGYNYKGKLGLFFFNYFFVKKLIKKIGKIDIFHGPAHSLPFFKVKNTFHVLTIHDLIFKKIPKSTSLIFRTYHNYFLKRSLKQADHIIAVSHNTAKDLREEYSIPENKITVIYPGIHELFLSETSHERTIPKKYFLSVSTHPYRKNLSSVLDAISLSEKLKEYTYVIAGDISKKQIFALTEKAKALRIDKNVLIKGYVSQTELASLYEHAEFLIYPSFYEGFGFPILEAFACKCPVITSNISSMPELMPHKEWLIDPHNTSNLTKVMEKMLTLSHNERNTLISDNLNFSKQFRWEKTADTTLKLFSDCYKKFHAQNTF